jgi:hypothetical protein
VKPDPCYREATNGVYFTKNAHRLDCDDPACRGCTTCAGTHCTARKNCTWHVSEGELTCGRCIAGVRRDLAWITALSALLLTQAIADGLDSEAVNLAGPAVDPEAWSWRKATAKQGRAWHVSLVEDDDEHHPLRVLGAWEHMIREDYQHHSDATLTLAGASAYLDRMLYRIAHDEEQDFPLLRAELKKCRQHLESVLHNDTKPDVGAPCPSCREAGEIVRLKRQYAHWCKDPECQKFHFLDDASDTWHCPREATHWWTQQGYADMLDERRGA